MREDQTIPRPPKGAKGKVAKARINEQIKVPEVRLIDKDGDQAGIVSLDRALQMARDDQLDLVEITPNAEPPVCRIMDFGKFLYEQGKKQAAAKKKQKFIKVKEQKFRPGTEEGDYQVKIRNLIRFLENGDKAKVTLRFRGREIAYQELAMSVFKRIEQDLEPYGVIEQTAKREGRQLTMVFAPKKK